MDEKEMREKIRSLEDVSYKYGKICELQRETIDELFQLVLNFVTTDEVSGFPAYEKIKDAAYLWTQIETKNCRYNAEGN